MGFVSGLFDSLAQAQPPTFWIVTALLGFGGLLLFAYGFVVAGRARIIQDTPTSKVRSAAQGYVELEGHARLLPGPEIRSPLSQARCCWWEFKVEQRRTRQVSGKLQSDWVVVEQGTSDELFLLCDDTGEAVVDPTGAQVIPSLSRVWCGYHKRPQTFPRHSPWLSLGDYRYTERLLQYGDALYALGHFASQTAVREDDEARDVAELLALWKRDRRELLQRFDSNRDGQIDLAEWEAARRAARDEVRSHLVERSVQPDLHVLGKPPDRRPYILSSRSQEQLVRRFRWAGLACVSAGIALGAAAVTALAARGLL